MEVCCTVNLLFFNMPSVITSLYSKKQSQLLDRQNFTLFTAWVIQSFQWFAMSQISGLKFKNTVKCLVWLWVLHSLLPAYCHVCVWAHMCMCAHEYIFPCKECLWHWEFNNLHSAFLQTLLPQLYPLLWIFGSFCLCNLPNTLLLSLCALL
jgi:hypothetical protein